MQTISTHARRSSPPNRDIAEYKREYQDCIAELHEKWRLMLSKDDQYINLETKRAKYPDKRVKHPVFLMAPDQASTVKGDIYLLQKKVESWSLPGWSPDWQAGTKNRKLDAFELPRLIEGAKIAQVIRAEAWSSHDYQTKADLLAAMQSRIDELNNSKLKRAPAYAKRMQQIAANMGAAHEMGKIVR